MPNLTKSHYMKGRQCQKLLWREAKDKDNMPEHDLVALYRFEVGKQVGDLAKEWYPEGIDIPSYPPDENAAKTKELLPQRKPLFEPGFLFEGLYQRVDLLIPAKNNAWDLIEVKSSAEVKDMHYHDVAFQKFVCEKFGLRINKCFLMFINKEYTRQGNINPKKLLTNWIWMPLLL
jgi:hypothetical protein